MNLEGEIECAPRDILLAMPPPLTLTLKDGILGAAEEHAVARSDVIDLSSALFCV